MSKNLKIEKKYYLVQGLSIQNLFQYLINLKNKIFQVKKISMNLLAMVKFEIINKIPRFVDKLNYANNFGFQWNKSFMSFG